SPVGNSVATPPSLSRRRLSRQHLELQGPRPPSLHRNEGFRKQQEALYDDFGIREKPHHIAFGQQVVVSEPLVDIFLRSPSCPSPHGEITHEAPLDATRQPVQEQAD